MFATGAPVAKVVLDKERSMGFTFGAIARAKEILGESAFTSKVAADRTKTLPAYVWACLSKDDRADLSLEDVAELIHPGNADEIEDAVSSLIERSLSKGAEGNGGKPAKK